ncbi:uncharacterized protein TRIADDRAFT_59708 [Trichoplax adhaerens]|uniref:Uncharacterized protein n=1 Tax=Trichoplax adhaerens TaxID=10228 RepID=B3S679_TRIAD|nr:predicted protein [Trichoplax adhaerens]EDV21576.1 predicted protein [Trichoplax adhaerens]|eukprot:XP_002115724.1 predicted protein [Trichoplax adhaerens]
MAHILQELLAENQKLREDILDLREENRVLLDDKKALIENDSKNKEQIMKLREEIRKEQKEKKNILEEKNSMIEKLRILQGILSNTPGHSPDHRDKYDGDKLVNESIDKGSPLPQITNRMSSLNNVGDDNEHNKKSYHSTTHFSDNQLHLDHKKKLKEFQHPDSKLENSIDSSMEKLAISDRGHIIDSRVPQSMEPSNLILKTVEASVTQDHNIPRDGAFSQTSSSYAATFPRQKLISNDHQWKSVEGNDRPLQQRQHDVEGKIMSSNPALVKTLVSSSANQNHAINNGNSPEAMKLYDLSYIRDIVNPYKHKKPKKAFKHGSVEQWEIKKSQIPKKQVPQSLYKSQDKQEEGYYGMYRFNQITKQLHRTVENRFFVRQPGLSTTVTSTMHPEQIYHFNEKLSQELKELDGQIRMYQDKPIKPE